MRGFKLIPGVSSAHIPLRFVPNDARDRFFINTITRQVHTSHCTTQVLISSAPFAEGTAAYETEAWAGTTPFCFLRRETHECRQEGDIRSSSRHLVWATDKPGLLDTLLSTPSLKYRVSSMHAAMWKSCMNSKNHTHTCATHHPHVSASLFTEQR